VTAVIPAFAGSHEIKRDLISRVRSYKATETLTDHVPWEDLKEPSGRLRVGAYKWSNYPAELGIPDNLAYIQECLFEGMPFNQSMELPERFLSSIPVGADLSLAWSRFAVWLFEVELERYATSKPVAALYSRRIAGDEPSDDDWRGVRYTETSRPKSSEATESAARAARHAARAASERGAGWTAEVIAAVATTATAYLGSRRGGQASCSRMAFALTEILGECK